VSLESRKCRPYSLLFKHHSRRQTFFPPPKERLPDPAGLSSPSEFALTPLVNFNNGDLFWVYRLKLPKQP